MPAGTQRPVAPIPKIPTPSIHTPVAVEPLDVADLLGAPYKCEHLRGSEGGSTGKCEHLSVGGDIWGVRTDALNITSTQGGTS